MADARAIHPANGTQIESVWCVAFPQQLVRTVSKPAQRNRTENEVIIRVHNFIFSLILEMTEITKNNCDLCFKFEQTKELMFESSEITNKLSKLDFILNPAQFQVTTVFYQNINISVPAEMVKFWSYP